MGADEGQPVDPFESIRVRLADNVTAMSEFENMLATHFYDNNPQELIDLMNDLFPPRDFKMAPPSVTRK